MRSMVRKLCFGLVGVLLGSVLAIGVPSIASASNGGTEHFFLVFTSQRGPGSIFASGVFRAGGKEYQGNKVDLAVFPRGAFSIVHSSAHLRYHFDSRTCMGYLSGRQVPFSITDGYGAFRGISGSGHADVNGIFETSRRANGTCSHHVTAFAEEIHATAGISFR